MSSTYLENRSIFKRITQRDELIAIGCKNYIWAIRGAN